MAFEPLQKKPAARPASSPGPGAQRPSAQVPRYLRAQRPGAQPGRPTPGGGVAGTGPGALLDSLAQAPVSSAVAVSEQVHQASGAVLEAQRAEAQAGLPKLPAPTGLPARERTPPKRETPPGLPAAALELPLASERPPQSPASPTSTSSLERPTVDLSGEADPSLLVSAHDTSEQQTRETHDRAARALEQDLGEDTLLLPAPDDRVLTATLSARSAGSGTAPPGSSSTASLPAEALASLDAEATPLLHERLDAERQRYTQAEVQYTTGSQASHAKAQEDITALEEEARAAQSDVRASAHSEVALARREGQEALDQVDADFQDKSLSARREHHGRIQAEAQTGNREADEHLARAEHDAEQERRRAEAEVEQREAEGEPEGFWSGAKSAAKTVVSGLKAAVDFIYDNLREAVKALFEAAKALALAAIELARKAIVGLIQAYGELLKGLVRLALAAFPEIRDRMLRRMDEAIDQAVRLVNAVAEGLKKGVAAVLDFLAESIDKLLGLIQDLYQGILTVVGMLVTGELRELLARMGQVVEAAGTAPGQFETAAYEELLGGNLDQPLSPEELMAAGRMPPAAEAGADPGARVRAGSEPEQEDALPTPPWTEGNVGVEQVAANEQLSPELSAELLQWTNGGEGELIFGESEDADRSLAALLGTRGPEGGGEQAAVPDGLTPRERAEIKWEVMKKGLAGWWSANWPYVLAGGVVGLAGFIVANILTGGALLAALPAVMSVVGALFTGVMVLQLAGHVRDFLQKGWNGDLQGGGKSLARGLAAGAIELISWLTFKTGSVALKGARAAATGVVKGARAMARGTASVARGALRIAQRGGSYLLKGGKVLLRGVGQGISRGIKRLRELGARLLSRTRFKGFRIRIQGRRFFIEGRINPWVLLIEGKFEEVPEGTPGAREVDYNHWASGRLDARYKKSQHTMGVDDAKRAREARGQAHQDSTQLNAEKRVQARLDRQTAIEELKQVDSKLKTEPGGGEGHGHKDHGYQTRLEDQRRRVETGRSPSGRAGERGKPAAKFYTPEAEWEALTKGKERLKRAVDDGYPTMRGDKPNRFACEVTADSKKGFGGGYKPKLDAQGNLLMEPVKKIEKAWVVFEYMPVKNDWGLLTFYPSIH